MGRGKKWGATERKHLALAWGEVTNDPVVGRYQTAENFALKVKLNFVKRGPAEADVEEGTYGHRSAKSMMAFFRSSISPDVMKFNNTLRKVKGANLSGLTAEEKMRIAVALHVRALRGEMPSNPSAAALYKLKDEDPKEWVNFYAHLVLKNHPKYAEQLNRAEPEEEEEDDAPPATAAATNPLIGMELQQPRVSDVANSSSAESSLLFGGGVEDTPTAAVDDDDNFPPTDDAEPATPSVSRISKEAVKKIGRNKAKHKLKSGAESQKAVQMVLGNSQEMKNKSLAGALGNALKASITDGMKRAARLLGEKLGNSLYQENFNIHKAPTTLSAALTSYDQERVRTKFPETKKPPATTKTTSTPSTATAATAAAAAAGTSSVTGATKPATNSYTPAPPLAVDTSNIPVQHTNMPPPLVTPSAAIPSNTSPYNIPPPMPSEALLGGLFRPESAHGSRKMPSDTLLNWDDYNSLRNIIA